MDIPTTTALVLDDQAPIELAARRAPALKTRRQGWMMRNDITEHCVRTSITQNEGLYEIRDNWKEIGHEQTEAQRLNDRRQGGSHSPNGAGWADGDWCR